MHLSFDGPGAVAISWVTWPQEEPEYDRLRDVVRGSVPEEGYEDDSMMLQTFSFSRKMLRAREQTIAKSLFAGMEPPHHHSDCPHHHGHHHHRGHHHHHHHVHDRFSDVWHSDHCKAIRSLDLAPAVQWGTGPGNYDRISRGHFECYSTESYDSGALHKAVMGDEEPLPPNTAIYYRVGDINRNVWSKEWSFTTPPQVGIESLPYRLGLVGDLGQTEHSLSTLKHLQEHHTDSVILAGDLSYADGYQPRWDTWGRLVTPATASQIWMFTEGNHEIEPTDGAPDFLAFSSRFHMPHETSGSASPLFYSYEVAGAHVLMLGSYVDYSRDSEQFKWLKLDLASIDRARTPWVIAVFHAPWYNSNYNHYGDGEEMRRSMEQILYEYAVDVVVAGHVHAYERSKHVYDNEEDECGPVYINVGDGGNREGLDFDYFKQPSWSAYRDPSYGHGILDMVNSTHAHFSWYRNQDGQKEVADGIWLLRNPECASQNESKRRVIPERSFAYKAKQRVQDSLHDIIVSLRQVLG